jgi:hypothetical protein
MKPECVANLLGACPWLCSGRGEYKNGECACKPGWKGKECSIRYEECEVSNKIFASVVYL